jgi:hypothetical protein
MREITREEGENERMKDILKMESHKQRNERKESEQTDMEI